MWALCVRAINLVLPVVVLCSGITCSVIEQFSKGSRKLNLEILTTNVLFYLSAVPSHSILFFSGTCGCGFSVVPIFPKPVSRPDGCLRELTSWNKA